MHPKHHNSSVKASVDFVKRTIFIVLLGMMQISLSTKLDFLSFSVT